MEQPPRRVATSATMAAALLSAARTLDVASKSGLMPKMPTPKQARIWTCRRCGSEFTPHRAKDKCDDCMKEIWGE